MKFAYERFSKYYHAAGFYNIDLNFELQFRLAQWALPFSLKKMSNWASWEVGFLCFQLQLWHHNEEQRKFFEKLFGRNRD